MATKETRVPSLVRAGEGIVAGIDGGAAGEKGMGECRAAIVRQATESWVERHGNRPGDIAIYAWRDAGASIGLANEVVSLGGEIAEKIRASSDAAGVVSRYDRITQHCGLTDPSPFAVQFGGSLKASTFA
jgi:hypothetical protein